MNDETNPALLGSIEDVRAWPLGRLAYEGSGALCHVLPGYDANQLARAAFQSSI